MKVYNVDDIGRRAIINGKFIPGEICTCVGDEIIVKSAGISWQFNETTHHPKGFFTGKEGQEFNFEVSGENNSMRVKLKYIIINTIDDFEYTTLHFEQI